MDNKKAVLQHARENKNDEFYTTYESVEEEMRHYKDHFRGKTVYCNADDPRRSEFSRYFQNNFKQLGLKRLIVTSYNRDNTSDNGKGLVLDMTDEKEKQVRNLEGDGDFRSEECIRLLDESDIVVTNPPFSLMREMVSLLESHKKNYLLVATENVLTYKEVFPLVQQGKLWTGYHSGNMNFRVPDDYETRTNRYWQDENSQKWRSLGNVVWLTNLETDKHRKRLELTKTYTPEQYPKYDNYDAINVDRVENIPMDYPGVMGVPVTILKKINTEQFEIVGEANHGTDSKFDLFERKLDGKTLFKKILIKNKSLMENEKIENKNIPSPERVSFESKEDLKAYITDYCEKHGWDSDLNYIDVSKITDMRNLFYGLPFKGNISKWDVSNVTTMEGMFALTDFNGDISGWNTGKVTNMSNMFAFSHFNQPIGNWDTSRVKTMVTMFHYSKFNQPLDKWDTSSVETMAAMFRDSQFNQPIGGWNVSKVRYLNDIFSSSPFNQPINDWNTGNVTDMSNMFADTKFNQPINKWDTSRVRYMVGMFYNSEFNQPINDWNVGNVMYTTGMFTRSKFNQPLDRWNVSSVLQARGMFEDSQFDQDISGWKLNPTVKTGKMFEGCPYSHPLPQYVKESQESNKDNTMVDSEENVKQQSETYYMKVSLLQGIDKLNKDIFSRLEKFRTDGDNESLLSETAKLDTIKGTRQSEIRVSPSSHPGDEVIASDDSHALVYNNDRRTYELLRKVTEQDIRAAIKRNGFEINSPEVVVNIYRKIIKENFQREFENPYFTMPSGDTLHFRYNEETNKVEVGTKNDNVFDTLHTFDFDLDKDISWNISDVHNKLMELPEYQEKTAPERVSFESKEDLKAYIKDYCGKHGWDSDLNHINVSKITDMSQLFMGTIFTGDISKWDVSNVRNMSHMFRNTQFNGDLSGWNTSKVEDMQGMFSYSKFNQPIDKWDTSNVKKMLGMFSYSKFNQPIGNWNVSNVKDMSYMFMESPFNQPIGNWNTGNVESMSFMFYLTPFNQPLDNWNTSKVENMEYMFYYNRKFNQPIGNWDVSNVKYMSYMFKLSLFNHSINNWNVSNVKDMTAMFASNKALEKMPDWKLTPSVVLEDMFKGTKFEGQEESLKRNIPEKVSFDTKEDLKSYIENYCCRNGWDSDLNHIDVSEIKDMSGLFAGTRFKGDISKWDVSNVTDMRAMFKDCDFNGSLSEWNTKNVENMSRMFDNSMFNGDITNWNIENVKYMNSMFLDSYFTGDISKLNIPVQADTEDMFADSNYELLHPGWKDEIEMQKKRATTIKEETTKQDTTMEKREDKVERQSIILSPEQLLDRAMDTAQVGNGKWLNHKSIRSPQLYGYSSRNPENSLSAFQQVLLSLNTHENQFHTNIYVTRDGIKDCGLALAGDQKGVLVPGPDGSSRQYFNLEQLDPSTVRDGYANSLLARSKTYKTLKMSETDDVTRNRELIEKDPSSIVLFRKGERFYLYEESAMRLKDIMKSEIRTTPETGVKYTTFKGEDIDRYIKAISDSGHRVVIANSAYSFKGVNIRQVENRAIHNIQTIAANEGFTIGRVTYMPSNYMPKSDTVSLNVTNKERNTLDTLREIGDIYRAGLDALYSDNRLAGYQKLPMGQRQARKFSQLVLEVATGVQMLRQGLPAVFSDDSIPLIPYWQQELRENSKAIHLLETHVDALTEAYDRSVHGHSIDYDLLLPSDKEIRRDAVPVRPEQETISRSLGDYANLQERKFVVVRDSKESAAIVIFPTGASTVIDDDTKGFKKDNIHDILSKEGFTQVYFFTPDSFESMNKTNEYFKGLQITVERMHYGKMEKMGRIDVGQEISRTLNPEFSAIVPFINAATNKRELYMRTSEGEELTVPLSKSDIKRLASTVNQSNRAAANQIRIDVAHKYYIEAKANPGIVSDYLHPDIPAEKYGLIERSWVTSDERKDYFIGATIDGKKYPLRQMSFADKSLFIFSGDKESFKNAIVTRVFAEELGLGVKSGVSKGVSDNGPAVPTDKSGKEEEQEQPRRSFRR